MAGLARRGTWDPFQGLTNLMNWDPFKEYGGSFPMPRYFEREADAFVPKFEVRENKEALLVKADLPGVKSEDLDVSVHGNVLSITGKREWQKQTEEEQVHMLERSFGSFTRSFTMPEGIDAKRLEAELKDGVLTLTLPKAPEAKPQKVAIKVK
jgi:HSP20 family protein